VWIAHCWSHKIAKAFCGTLLHGYGPELDPSALHHLLPSEKAAVDAAESVARYLRRETMAKPIFSLLSNDATMDFARGYARERMASEWARERLNAAQRQEEHWREVEQKKNRLIVLDAQLARF
jgi:hypothetical protein